MCLVKQPYRSSSTPVIEPALLPLYNEISTIYQVIVSHNVVSNWTLSLRKMLAFCPSLSLAQARYLSRVLVLILYLLRMKKNLDFSVSSIPSIFGMVLYGDVMTRRYGFEIYM